MTAPAHKEIRTTTQTKRSTPNPDHTKHSRNLSRKDFFQPAKSPEWLEAEKNLELPDCVHRIIAGEKYKLIATCIAAPNTDQPTIVYLQDRHHHLLPIPLPKICSSFIRANCSPNHLSTKQQ